MPETVASRPLSRQGSSPVAWPLIAACVVVALMLGGTVLLWAHYGSTVFFEMIRSGFAACFG